MNYSDLYIISFWFIGGILNIYLIYKLNQHYIEKDGTQFKMDLTTAILISFIFSWCLTLWIIFVYIFNTYILKIKKVSKLAIKIKNILINLDMKFETGGRNSK